MCGMFEFRWQNIHISYLNTTSLTTLVDKIVKNKDI